MVKLVIFISAIVRLPYNVVLVTVAVNCLVMAAVSPSVVAVMIMRMTIARELVVDVTRKVRTIINKVMIGIGDAVP